MEMDKRQIRINGIYLIIIFDRLVDIAFHVEILSGMEKAFKILRLLVVSFIQYFEQTFGGLDCLLVFSVFYVGQSQQREYPDIVGE